MAQRIVVLGGNGFVGRHVVGRLVAAGHRVIVPTRRRESAKDLIVLPTVDVVEENVNDPAALARVLAGADTVVNLVAILNEAGRSTFTGVHVDLVRSIVGVCHGAGVRRLVHMSALGADPAGPSQYLKTKAAGEAIVMASGLRWTIFRPSVIFGRDDSFLNMFAQLSKSLPVVALAAPNARFQPIYVEDVAHCVVQSVTDDLTVHVRYDLCGPKIYTLRQLVAYAGEVSGVVRPIVPLGPGLSKLQATLLEHLPGKLMSRDNLLSTQKDNVCDCPFPAVFGISPLALEAVAPQYLSPSARRSAFDPYRAQGGR